MNFTDTYPTFPRYLFRKCIGATNRREFNFWCQVQRDKQVSQAKRKAHFTQPALFRSCKSVTKIFFIYNKSQYTSVKNHHSTQTFRNLCKRNSKQRFQPPLNCLDTCLSIVRAIHIILDGFQCRHKKLSKHYSMNRSWLRGFGQLNPSPHS